MKPVAAARAKTDFVFTTAAISAMASGCCPRTVDRSAKSKQLEMETGQNPGQLLGNAGKVSAPRPQFIKGNSKSPWPVGWCGNEKIRSLDIKTANCHFGGGSPVTWLFPESRMGNCSSSVLEAPDPHSRPCVSFRDRGGERAPESVLRYKDLCRGKGLPVCSGPAANSLCARSTEDHKRSHFGPGRAENETRPRLTGSVAGRVVRRQGFGAVLARRTVLCRALIDVGKPARASSPPPGPIEQPPSIHVASIPD